MKVEEIQLAFETNVQLALIDDIKKSVNDFNIDFEKALGGVEIARNFSKTGLAKTQNALDLVNKAILMAKEIGIDTKELDRWKDVINNNIKSWNTRKDYLFKI